jgi:hypothetical protein
MTPFLEGKSTKENIPVKRFGYLLSAILLVLANIGLISNWAVTPFLFLATMYFLTGSLWVPGLVRPFYNLFGKYIVKPSENTREEKDSSKFSEN